MSEATQTDSPIDAQRRSFLDRCLEDHFDLDDPSVQGLIASECEFIDVPAGTTLIHQGDASDAVYFLVLGRMRAMIDQPDGTHLTVGEIGRGETVGELALFTGKPRSADVVAIRDSVVAMITADGLQRVISTRPDISFRITRRILSRATAQSGHAPLPSRAVTFTLLPISPDMETLVWAKKLVELRESHGERVKIIDAAYIRDKTGGLENPDGAMPRAALGLMLAEIELDYDAVIFIASAVTPAWSQAAIQHSDEVVLLADARGRPDASDLERAMLEKREDLRPAISLVLVHPQDTTCPKNTIDWLSVRNVMRHIHIRKDHDADARRLARILSGHAVGLVFSGGADQHMWQLGATEELRQSGLAFDFVAATGTGVVPGFLAAMERCDGDALDSLKAKSLLPFRPNTVSADDPSALLSEISFREALEKLIGHLGYTDMGIEDCWISFITLGSDLTSRRAITLDQGNILQNLQASSSTPGLHRAVSIYGQYVFEGGLFEALPTKAARELGARTVVAIDPSCGIPQMMDSRSRPSGLKRVFRKIWPGFVRPDLKALSQTLMTASSVRASQTDRDTIDLLITFGDHKDRPETYEAAHKAGLKAARSALDGLSEHTRAALTIFQPKS